MTQITLDISDKKASLFITPVKGLDLKVKKQKKVSLEDELTPGQKKTWENIKRGFEQMKLIEAGKMKTTSGKYFLKELKNEGYL